MGTNWSVPTLSARVRGGDEFKLWKGQNELTAVVVDLQSLQSEKVVETIFSLDFFFVDDRAFVFSFFLSSTAASSPYPGSRAQPSDEMVKATKKKPSSSSSSGGKKGGIKKKGGSSGKKRSANSAAAEANAATDAAAAALARPDTPSLGMRTSSISNKLVRKDQYAKLKHKQKVKKEKREREERKKEIGIAILDDDGGG